MKLVTLKKRRDFVLSNKHGQKTHNKNFILQEYCNPNISDQGLMFGFTATKRIGNAVKRNRIKRKLKAITQKILKIKGAINTNYTYIIICKTKSYTEKYDKIFLEMQKSFKKLN